MKKYVIEESTIEEYGLVDNGIVEYNLSKVSFTQEPSFISINKVIKGSNGDVLAGINSLLYCWNWQRYMQWKYRKYCCNE